MTQIDMQKNYTTRDGREIRLYAIDGREPYSIHGAIKTDGGWVCYSWFKDGSSNGDLDIEDSHDLIIQDNISQSATV